MKGRPLKKAVFEGLVFAEDDQQLSVAYVGVEPCYVIDDDGFMRHISAEKVDRQIWEELTRGIEGNEDFLSQKAAEMMGQEDPFSIAVIRSQFERTDEQFAQLQEIGFPEDARMYLGMVGFKAIVNYRGELIELKQPTAIEDGE
jgi:hypothetical protein